MGGLRGGGGKRKHETQRASEGGREGGRAKERVGRGAVQAYLLYLLVTEREREREKEQLKAETTGVHGFPKRK